MAARETTGNTINMTTIIEYGLQKQSVFLHSYEKNFGIPVHLIAH